MATQAERWQQYLQVLRGDFTKIARLEFLYQQGEVAFAVGNNVKGRNSGAFLQDGSLTVNLQNGKRRTATVTLANLNGDFDYSYGKLWFGQKVRLSEGVILPDGTEFYLPQGVFYIRDPEERLMPGQKSITLHLEDKWSYLDGTLFGRLDGIYEVPRGTNIYTAIESLLLDEGIAPYVIDRVAPDFTAYYNGMTTTLPDGSTAAMTAMPYTYRNDSDSGTRADIILEMAGVIAAWVGYDATGRLVVAPGPDDVPDSEKPVQWTFEPTEKQFLGASYVSKNTEVYNDIIIVGESLSQYGYTAGRAQNNDMSSVTNTSLIGMRTLRESAAGYYTNEQCERLAVFKLKRQTILNKSVTIQSSQIFHLNENQLIIIRRPDKAGNPEEKHLVTGFTRPIAQNGPMQINATSIYDIANATIVPIEQS